MDVPFFNVTQLISPQGKQAFLDFVSQKEGVSKGLSAEQKKESIESQCCHFLSKCVMCLNPEMAVQYGEKFLNEINVPKIQSNAELRLSLLLHIGFMLERNICRKEVVFDDQNLFIAQNDKLFQLLRSNMYILESVFEVKINDAEICFLIQAITQDKGKKEDKTLSS